MTLPENRPAGAPCWIDLVTSDIDAAQAFYGGLFGWTGSAADQATYGGYVTFTLEGNDVAGCMGKDSSMQAMPDHWSVYLSSPDARATTLTAQQRGAPVFVEPTPIPEVGVMAVLADPGGASVGVWQADPFAGFEALGEPGTPTWFELHSRSYGDAVGFYRDVFGWETEVMSDSPEFRYTTLGSGPDAAAGVVDASGWSDQEELTWHVYFAVSDSDAACAKVTELGGSVKYPPEDSPYGRIATVRDPGGAVFKLMGPNTDSGE
ncbi:MAG: VOC family protein [Nocardioides sp.]